ncbi:uncharacterized protein BT62DRAFT_938562 [Guyanagaster necrorhizus]|uniref:HMG box domain-containing protein n=1 Tax=Guyanagaster necrorhizus TaxID=856835 RepID=A0A9P7VFX1_9AGAR|nr:uncharacterized protein BT62DRAFT_938562 [Guyanagaster necrorhizus MCA 3950]KAG7439838.1 hypothetical protein BT62DRAFT_938562 [Guyanagaster necrorhizus MCA 3950]
MPKTLSGDMGTQIVWTLPCSPSSHVHTPAQSPRHSKKKPPSYIPRPPNAFILFRSSFIKSQHVSTDVETNHSTLSKIIGMTWQGLPEGERQVWHDKARAALDEHRQRFPGYAFRPGKEGGETKAKARRKVREVEPKDTKRCAKIAELLVEGLKGAQLDKAIKEFDKTHVPEIITRFEVPITESAFRQQTGKEERRRKISSGKRERSTPPPLPPLVIPEPVAPIMPEAEAPVIDLDAAFLNALCTDNTPPYYPASPNPYDCFSPTPSDDFSSFLYPSPADTYSSCYDYGATPCTSPVEYASPASFFPQASPVPVDNTIDYYLSNNLPNEYLTDLMDFSFPQQGMAQWEGFALA